MSRSVRVMGVGSVVALGISLGGGVIAAPVHQVSVKPVIRVGSLLGATRAQILKTLGKGKLAGSMKSSGGVYTSVDFKMQGLEELSLGFDPKGKCKDVGVKVVVSDPERWREAAAKVGLSMTNVVVKEQAFPDNREVSKQFMVKGIPELRGKTSQAARFSLGRKSQDRESSDWNVVPNVVSVNVTAL